MSGDSDAQAAPFEDEIREFERLDALDPPPRGAVLFLGSSSLRLWDTLERDMAGFSVVNRGFGGSIIEQSTLYAPRIAWPYEPRLIVMYAGDNDLASGKSALQVLADFQEFVARMREALPASSLAFISIKPSPSRAELREEASRANALVRACIEGERERGLRFLDVWAPMTDDRGAARPELFGPDDLHMNARGYALWTQLIRPHLHAILDTPPHRDAD